MMRTIYPIISAILVIVISCKKDNSNTGLAALNIVHAAADVPSIYAYLTLSDSAYYLHRTSIGYGSSLEYGVPSGESPLSLVSSADTTKALFKSTLQLKNGCIYSLYLMTGSKGIDTLLLQDNIPFHTDSVTEVRVINLSEGSSPITVNLEGNSDQPEFAGIGYKQISPFKKYPVANGITSYNFEVRDQSGNWLTTFSLNFTVFKSHTLVISGSEDISSSTPLSVFQVNNF